MITYNEIYETLRKEKYSEQLQPLPKNFIPEIGEYIKDKGKVSEQEHNLFSQATAKSNKQLENAISLFHELMTRRKKKILTLAFIAIETGISKRDYENLADFEKEMFDKIVKSLEESTKKIEDYLHGIKENSNLLIMFLEDVDEFLDFEGNKIGPFTKGEISNLSKETAEILIESNKAEIVEEG